MIHYPGAKGQIAKTIISLFPEDYPSMSYIEPFGGSAKILYIKEPSSLEVYNDNNRFLYCVYKCIQDNNCADELLRRLTFTLNHEDIFYDSQEKIKEIKNKDFRGIPIVDIAYYVIITSVMSFNGTGNGYSAVAKHYNKRYNSHTQVAFERLVDWHNRLRRVVILNRDFREVINKFNDENFFIYADPPYFYGVNYSYILYSDKNNTWSKEDHHDLANLLRAHKGLFCLSIDICPEIKKLYKGFNLYVIKSRKNPNYEVSGTEYVEGVITNYDANVDNKNILGARIL